MCSLSQTFARRLAHTHASLHSYSHSTRSHITEILCRLTYGQHLDGHRLCVHTHTHTRSHIHGYTHSHTVTQSHTHNFTHTCMASPITHTESHTLTHTLSLLQWRSCAPLGTTTYYGLRWALFLPHTAGSLWGETHLSTPGIYEPQKPGHCLFGASGGECRARISCLGLTQAGLGAPALSSPGIGREGAQT